MKEKEYREKLEKIEQKLIDFKREIKKEKEKLMIEFAKSNNPHKIGDIIKDHYKKIKIEKISFYIDVINGLPMCVYHGVLFTKKNEPYKSGKEGKVYQRNIEKEEL